MRHEFEEIRRKEDDIQDDLLKVTAKMFRTVFTEIKTNIAFNCQPDMIQLLRLNGIEMGVHHFDKNGAQRISQSMSAHMHRQLLQPFSIIIDGSCDNTDTHYLIVYFQILENDVPSVVFYRLVETSSDVTALGYFKSLTEVLKSEEIDSYSYFKENLIGFIYQTEKM